MPELRPTTHFPAVPLLPQTPSCAIVRATRGSDFSCINWNGTERRGGFLMESGAGAKLKTANLFYVLGALLSSLGQIRLLRLERILAPCPGFTAGGVAPAGSGKRLIMKIMIFCINSYKFTGFLDKLMKRLPPVIDCNKRSYYISLSAPHSDMAVKKVFRRPRISPQQPAFAPAPHHLGNPPPWGC